MPMSYQEEQTLHALAARAAVQDLTIRHYRAFVERDLPTWIGTFVVRGVLEVPGQEPIKGHPALERWFNEATPPGLILLVDSIVQVEGVHGTQQSRSLATTAESTAERMVFGPLIRFDDEVIYERGRWYFGRRRMLPPQG